jgi:hypothetical protein
MLEAPIEVSLHVLFLKDVQRQNAGLRIERGKPPTLFNRVVGSLGDSVLDFCHYLRLDFFSFLFGQKPQNSKIESQVLPDPLKRFGFPLLSFLSRHDFLSLLKSLPDSPESEARAKPTA